jgi:hypothetical protein
MRLRSDRGGTMGLPVKTHSPAKVAGHTLLLEQAVARTLAGAEDAVDAA